MTVTDRLYALSLALAGTAMLVLPARALASYVDLSRSHAKISCQGGETATINGSYDTVTVRGRCGTIAINGDDDVIHAADGADRVTVVGDADTVYYGGAAPLLDVREGSDDTLVLASNDNAKTAARLPLENGPEASANGMAAGTLASPSPQSSASVPLPTSQSQATAEPIDGQIIVAAAQAADYEWSAGAQLGPADTALNGGHTSDGTVTIVVGDGATYDAPCAGQTVEIGGDNGRVTLHGNCRFIRVSGNGIALAFDVTDELSITGDNDTYRYKSKPGSIEIFGLGDAVASR